MDFLHTQKDINGFCIISSDSDFTKLASRFRESRLEVIGYGKKSTPLSFTSACTEFVFVEKFLEGGIDEEEGQKKVGGSQQTPEKKFRKLEKKESKKLFSPPPVKTVFKTKNKSLAIKKEKSKALKDNPLKKAQIMKQIQETISRSSNDSNSTFQKISNSFPTSNLMTQPSRPLSSTHLRFGSNYPTPPNSSSFMNDTSLVAQSGSNNSHFNLQGNVNKPTFNLQGK